MTDINAVIAKHKGWMFHHKDDCLPPVYFREIGNDGQIEIQTLPDFKGDARLYMALFEEMELCALLNYEGKFQVKAYDKNYANVKELFEPVESDTIGTAICLAYMRLHGLE